MIRTINVLNRSKFKRFVHNHVSIRHCVTDRVVGVACHLSPLFGRHNGASPLKRAGRSVIGRRTGFPHARPGSSPKAAGATSEKLMPPILPNRSLLDFIWRGFARPANRASCSWCPRGVERQGVGGEIFRRRG